MLVRGSPARLSIQAPRGTGLSSALSHRGGGFSHLSLGNPRGWGDPTPLAVLCPWKDFPYIQPQPPWSHIAPTAPLELSALIKRSLGPLCLHLCRLLTDPPSPIPA